MAIWYLCIINTLLVAAACIVVVMEFAAYRQLKEQEKKRKAEPEPLLPPRGLQPAPKHRA